MIRLACPDNRSLNPAWVKRIDRSGKDNYVQIHMVGRDEYLNVTLDSIPKAIFYRKHLKLIVVSCDHAPSGEVLIYLESFGNFCLNLLKIESIARPENDCCVEIKMVDQEMGWRFPFNTKYEALCFAEDIESRVEVCNYRPLTPGQEEAIRIGDQQLRAYLRARTDFLLKAI